MTSFDRAKQDVGNVIALEHVNLQVPDQQLATTFYVTGLGLTRDPYLMTGTNNMWINVGRSQFHLPTGRPQVLRGYAGLVVPDVDALERRLSKVGRVLEGTRFAYARADDHVDAISPWGNRLRCHRPHPDLGAVHLGIAYVALDVPPGSADGIARFYREILAAPAHVDEAPSGRVARVSVGIGQELRFHETEQAVPDYDGHHIQIYLADFAGPHKRLAARGLITEESSEHQYRFADLVDLGSGKALYRLEHEMRSLRHPLYARPLVNRNPEQTNVDYAPGRDALDWHA